MVEPTSPEAVLACVAGLLAEARSRAVSDGIRWTRLLESAHLLASGGHRRPSLAPSDGDGDDPDVLTLSYAQVGLRLGVSERTVRRLVAAGQLPAVEVGHRPRIRPGDLDAYVAGLPVRPVALAG